MEKQNVGGTLFTCLNARAVFLETVWDLTPDTFILVLRRFCSKKGYTHFIQSDNVKIFFEQTASLKQS